MHYIVRTFVGIICLSLLASCTLFAKAPKPTECKGEYRPINVIEQKNASFDGSGKIVRCEDGGRNGNQS